MSSTTTEYSRKSAAVQKKETMEKRLVVFLKKEQLRLIVAKQYFTGLVGNTRYGDVDGVYKFEKLTSEEPFRLGRKQCDKIGYDMSLDFSNQVQSDTVLGNLRQNRKDSDVTKKITRTYTQSASKVSQDPLPLLKPKEYRCIVSYSTREHNWTDPVECGDLAETVRYLRKMNRNLNALYGQWQIRLENLVRDQNQYVHQSCEYLDWCILKILVELAEQISALVSPFLVVYSKFDKLFQKKTFRNSAIFSQISSIEDTICHFVLNAYNLKVVCDEYLDDLKYDFERLHKLITCRGLVKDASGRILESTKNAPWENISGPRSVLSQTACLAIRGSKILPWCKLQKITLQLNCMGERRNTEINKLQKKSKKQLAKALKAAGRNPLKFQKRELEIECKFQMGSSLIDYKYWKRKEKIRRKFAWKYCIKRYRGLRYQQHYLMNKNRIDLANKLFLNSRKSSLKSRLAWDIQNLTSGLSSPEIPPIWEIEGDVELANEVSVQDIWTLNRNKIDVQSSSSCFGSELTESGQDFLGCNDHKNTLSQKRACTSEPEFLQKERSANQKIVFGISKIQQAGLELTSFHQISEQHQVITKQIKSLSLSQSLNWSSDNDLDLPTYSFASQIPIEIETPRVHVNRLLQSGNSVPSLPVEHAKINEASAGT